MKRFSMLAGLLVISQFLMGCYGMIGYVYVESHQMALHLEKGVNPTQLFGPGQYSNSTLYTDIHLYDAEVKTVAWEDLDLQTVDKQQVGLSLSILVQRPKEQECAFKMFRNYRGPLDDDAALSNLVISQVPDVAKGVTSGRTLDQLINRGDAKDELFEKLRLELNEFCITLVDLGVQNISTSEAYRAALDAKAQSAAEADKAAADVIKAEAQADVTRAQNAIALETAQNDALIAAERAKLYEENPFALQLDMMKAWADSIKPTDKVIFMDPNLGSNLNFFMQNPANGEMQQPVIVPQPVEAAPVDQPPAIP